MTNSTKSTSQGALWRLIRWARSDAPTVLRADGKADLVAHAVLGALATYANSDRVARPSLATLADDARVTDRAAGAALRTLVGHGLIEPAGDYNGTPCWRLLSDLVRADRDDRKQRRDGARARRAERNRRYRERVRRDAEVERPETPNHASHNSPETPNLSVPRRRTSTLGDTEQTSSSQVTPPVTAIELPIEETSAPTSSPSSSTSSPSSSTTSPTSQPKKPSKPKTPKTPAPARADVDGLCAALAKAVIANGCKPPTIGKTWHDAARLLLDADGRALDQAHAVLAWSQRDSFWRKNILSMPTFRKQYDRLRLAWEDDGKPLPATAPPGTDHAAWLRAEWQAGRIGEICHRTGLEYPYPGLPLDVDHTGAKEWRRNHQRAWITTNHAEILARLASKTA